MDLDVHVVLHTHWDREWYHPVERFRQRLVALVDALLDDPPSPSESFLLDGQAIILEDYVGVRPDRAGRLEALLRDGRLEAGPWYVLADELIPSGEALVRNLLAGRRELRRFGVDPPPVLYCPDSFGHPAALPSIAAGFGLPLIILWRGYGGGASGSRWPAGDTVRWIAPSGDEALLFHLPRDGYEFGASLPIDASGARARWQRMRADLVPRSTTGVVLVPSGADHHARQRDWRRALDELEAAGEREGVHRSSLGRFTERLIERTAAPRAPADLPAVRGELRDSYGYTWTLQGTFATRAHEKRLNARGERLLTRDAEPWAALAARRGTSRRPLVEEAWRTLLAAHPHDTLCGCSIDEVADAMQLRLRSAITQAGGVREDSIIELLGHDPVAARESRDRWHPVVVLRNAAPRARSGVAVLDIEEFIADVPVGPGSAFSSQPGAVLPPRGEPGVPALGRTQVLWREIRYSRTESPQHYPDNDLVARTRVAAWVDDAPPYGLVSYSLSAEPGRRRRQQERVVVRGQTMRNSALAVTVGEHGSLALEHLGAQRRIERLLDFIDESDAGDLYTPSPRERPFAVEFRGVRRVHRGPLRGELLLRYRIVDGAPSAHRTDATLDVSLILDAGSPMLLIAIAGDNRREDHRLRLVVHSGLAGSSVYADAAFCLVRREAIEPDEADLAMETPPPTAPLHRYVTRFGEAEGLTVISDGLAEYEARDDGSVIVTLVRSVGRLSRSDLPERPGHAGWPMPTPGAQSLGAFAARFAILPHGPRLPDTIDAIERAADDALLPLVGRTLRSALELPAPVVGVELSGVGLAFSTLKEGEDGQWLVLRCVNRGDEEVEGRWRLPFDVSAARLARLDETIVSDLEWSGRDIPFVAAGRAIVTILVR